MKIFFSTVLVEGPWGDDSNEDNFADQHNPNNDA
jgi:hypothetical protein